jgi:hypothetical protein
MAAVPAGQRALMGSLPTDSSAQFLLIQEFNGYARSGYGPGVSAIQRSHAPFDVDLIVDKNKNVTHINGVNRASRAYEPFVSAFPMYFGTFNYGGGIHNSYAWFIGTCKRIETCQNDAPTGLFLPVAKGSRQFSSTPAPSNCFWNDIAKTYHENKGAGELGIREVTP